MDDLISEFITETSESLSVLDSELVKLEQNPNDQAILGNIFRLVHTIKGTCGFLGLPRLESVAHASENVLGRIRDKEIEVSPKAVSLILESLDTIKTIMDHLASNAQEPVGDDSDLIARLNKFAETRGLDDGTGGGAAPAAAVHAPTPAPEPVAAAPAPVEAAPAPVEKVEEKAAVPAPAPAAAKEAPPPPKAAAVTDISPKAQESAIKQGLQAEPKQKEATGGGDPSGLAGQSIRVNLDVLENLMQMVGELVLTRNQLLQIVRTQPEKDNGFMAPLQHLSYITTELQEGVMKTRMQPIGNAWAKFPRLIRDLSLELGKKIELRMLGAETELDRQLLEMIKDPLTHMVRNSCDHGLELPDERGKGGKPDTGTVTLSAFHEGGHIIIEISDDGRGINIERVKQKAVQNGLASQSELDAMTDQQITQFIFRAGFSTAEKVTSVSGRGVGMDVVRTNIEKIGGTIELFSTYGRGSKFSIKIPLTLAIVSVLIVNCRGERFAFPQINVLELVRATKDSEYPIEKINNAPVLRLRDKLLPLLSLSHILKLDTKPDNLDDAYIVVCRVGNANFGVIVDHIYDTEEIVVKPVSAMLQNIPVYSGNTILGDGSVIMILDPNGLARTVGEAEPRARETHQTVLGPRERLVSFLLFKAGKGAPKAVPLELVSRLEEVHTKDIELSGDHPVVQYRGDLMRLVTLNDNYTIPNSQMCEVVVFTYDNRTLGLVVEEILDIVEAPLAVKLTSDEQAYLGSMVIDGRTTDIVNVGSLLSCVVNLDDMGLIRAKEIAEKSYRLLFIDDSLFFRNLTVPFLTVMGYNVVGVSSGSEALRLLNEKHGFDAIISDIEMPEMNGFEFAEMCKSDPRYNKIPLIAFTSTINPQLLERGKLAGFNDFIVKTDRERLVQAISEQLHLEREAA